MSRKLMKFSSFQTLLFFSKRGARCPDTRLSLYWPKNDEMSFFKFLQKKVARLDKKGPAQLRITRVVGVAKIMWQNL